MDRGNQSIRLIQDIVGVTEAAAVATRSPSVISKDQEKAVAAAAAAVEEKKQVEGPDDCSTRSYQARTFRSGSNNTKRRAALLPAYPLPKTNTHHRVLLLLSNVPGIDRDSCEKQSNGGGYGVCPFEFKQYRFVESIDSFMMDLYRDLFIEPSRRWKIHYALIDYNLSRLRTCMQLYTEQTRQPALLSFQELPIALEFFLQIDVDIFFMKTCNFGGAQPRLFGANNDEPEGILCEAQPIARYGMIPCYDRNCFLCQSRQRGVKGSEKLKATVHFSPKQAHQFVNKYEAILNCDASCITSNVIYTLTCPCGGYDFVGSTSTSFHDRMLKHRDENNRAVREFLIGINNIDHILKQKLRKEETFANNNEILLYQHSPRCSLVLQRFLDRNLDYWCLVPMLWHEAKEEDDHFAAIAAASASSPLSEETYAYITARAIKPESPTFATKPKLFFDEVLRNNTRSIEECVWLSKGVPKPPTGYRFSRRQIEEQINFFKFKKEAHILPSNLVDYYKYTIVAVLPDDCSYELRQFIEALFITHAETKLNTFGRLTHKGSWPTATTSFDHTNRGEWCAKLTRR